MPRGLPRNTAAAPTAPGRRANNRPQVPFAYKLVLNQWLPGLCRNSIGSSSHERPHTLP